MPDKSIDPQVIIPYSTLCDLLSVSVELKKMRMEVKRLSDQHAMIKGQLLEICEKIRELE